MLPEVCMENWCVPRELRAAVPVVTMPRARPRLLSKYWQVIVNVDA